MMTDVHSTWSSSPLSPPLSPENNAIPSDLLESLSHHSLFQRSKNGAFLAEIACNMSLRTYNPRDVIIVKGEQAKAMFFLLRGRVEVCSADFEQIYATLDRGTCFGEIGILYAIPRTATVVAQQKCTVAILTAETVRSILPTFPEVERILRFEAQERMAMLEKSRAQDQDGRKSSIEYNIDNFTATSAYRQLQNVSLFKDCPEDFLHAISLKMEPRNCAPNTLIIQKGDIGHELFFIVDGTVEVLVEENDVIARLGPDAFFGEIAILLDVRRTADVRSVTPLELYVLSKKDFMEVCSSYPDLQERFKMLVRQSHDQIQERLANKTAEIAETVSEGASPSACIERSSVCSTTCDQDPTLPKSNEVIKLRERETRRRRASVAVWTDPGLTAMAEQRARSTNAPPSPSPSPPSPSISVVSTFMRDAEDDKENHLINLSDLVLSRILHFLDFGSRLRLAAVSQKYRARLLSPSLLVSVDLGSVNKKINDSVLQGVSMLIGPHVQILSLAHCFHVTDAGLLTLLQHAPNLRELNLNSCWLVTDKSLAGLPSTVEKLDLSNCRKVTDRGLCSLLDRQTSLTELTLSYCKNLTDQTMRLLNKSIQYLNLQRCTSITDRGFLDLNGPLPNLRSIDLSDCSFLTDRAILHLVEAAPNLERVSLSFCCALSDSAIEALAKLEHLQALDVSFCGSAVSDPSVTHLLEARSKTLQELNLRGCVRISGVGLMSALEFSEKLRLLNVSQCPGVSDQVRSLCGLAKTNRHGHCLLIK
ncbi:hypothetical protein BX666DRAFT_1645420 [Dichotomocladium elegans]|nr:hypothetical protein BX666DRAFT_1645420 [Dichotomocladium elegans]